MAALPEPISHTVLAIWDGYEKRSNHSDSRGVPMSMVAEECERKLWYQLHWASPAEVITGQKQRRFDTGNLEEDRLLTDLKNAGVLVERVDPATGTQFRVQLASGWLRGKMDAKAQNIPEAPKTVHVVECKSHNDKSFKELTKKKLLEGKKDHYAQCQSYMHAEHLTRCLYIAVNKNTDEIYTERVEYDHPFAVRLETKVDRIVRADQAPARLYPDPNAKSAFPCHWCTARPQCHEGEFARKNCRTCLSSEFLDGAVVRCTLWDKELDYKAQQAGCEKHLFLPSLVPGEQTDANEAERWVKYKLADGSEWMNGVAK